VGGGEDAKRRTCMVLRGTCGSPGTPLLSPHHERKRPLGKVYPVPAITYRKASLSVSPFTERERQRDGGEEVSIPCIGGGLSAVQRLCNQECGMQAVFGGSFQIYRFRLGTETRGVTMGTGVAKYQRQGGVTLALRRLDVHFVSMTLYTFQVAFLDLPSSAFRRLVERSGGGETQRAPNLSSLSMIPTGKM